jgi:hypothetical protein
MSPVWKRLALLALVLLWALAIPSAADDTLQIRRLIGRGFDPGSLRVAESWAVCGYFSPEHPDIGGMCLLHHMDGRWQFLKGMPGALDQQSAYRLGMPRQLASRIWPGKWKFDDGPYWPELSKFRLREFNAPDRVWVCTLMRNEVFARHGHVFADREMRNYFSQRAWYQPGKETPLSAIEQYNVRAIADYQSSRRR